MNEDLKRCLKCEMDCSKTNFHRDGKMKDGLRSSCKFCTNQCQNNNREK